MYSKYWVMEWIDDFTKEKAARPLLKISKSFSYRFLKYFSVYKNFVSCDFSVKLAVYEKLGCLLLQSTMLENAVTSLLLRISKLFLQTVKVLLNSLKFSILGVWCNISRFFRKWRFGEHVTAVNEIYGICFRKKHITLLIL